MRSDGAVYFTDPAYGIESDYEGHKGESGAERLLRLPRSIRSPATLTIVADDFDRPNGLAFSLDERLLYVSDTGAPQEHARARRRRRRHA